MTCSPRPAMGKPMVEHRFHTLPYGGSDYVMVVVCDCGWADITDSEPLGLGWDAALLYAAHLGIAEPHKHVGSSQEGGADAG